MLQNARDLIQRGDQLFGKRENLLNLWQEIAENFYPERADFIVKRSVGDEFAGNLSTSYPLLARRDLGNSIGGMLRPTAKEWFSIRAAREEREDQPAKLWLETMTQRMKRAMYDRAAKFNRATKECDHDWAAFGNGVISVELNRAQTNLLYRNWHLRDVAWCENAEGEIDTVHRKWKPTAYDLAGTFRLDKLHPTVQACLKRGEDLYKEFECRHVVVPWDQYDGPYRKTSVRTPFVSVYIDKDNEHVIEERPAWNRIYVIPRWQTVSGSQYAHSAAVVAAFPDARLIQAMTYTLLEAGEKATTPPMIATKNAIRGDVALYAGGITWVDNEYDERLGEVLRPISQDLSGMPIGIDMQRDTRAMISEAFFLNKLSLPPPGKDMTAYEVGQRIQEYIRQALPLFEPVETDYNGELCDITFDNLRRAGVFGSVNEIPESLQGADVQFRFESPLHEAIERQRGQKFVEVRDTLAVAMQIDQINNPNVDTQTALRDVLNGIHAPAKWLRDERAVEQMMAEAAQKAQGQQMMAQAAQIAEAAKPAAEASKAMAEAEAVRAAA